MTTLSPANRLWLDMLPRLISYGETRKGLRLMEQRARNARIDDFMARFYVVDTVIDDATEQRLDESWLRHG